MVIDFSRQKSDQAGERITPKHVFANPFLPEVCPILALGLHVFGISFRADRDDKTLLFEGTPYDSFTKWLHQALKKVSDLGYDAVDFGTHSFRKGAATHTSGFINGPSIISIFLRAGWSLGIVQDRYITQTQGGDQFLGRVACGLNFSMGSRFAVLPPSFRNSNVLTAEEWELICPGYSAHPVGFQATLPYLLASVVYHWDWLNAVDDNENRLNCSQLHPIFSSRLATSNLIPRLKASLLPLNVNGECTETGMVATGIPTHINLERQLEDLKHINERLTMQMTTQMEQFRNDLPNMVVREILNRCEVTGARQLTKDDLQNMLDRLQANLLQPAIVNTAPVNNTTVQLEPQSEHQRWRWEEDDSFHPVPENWKFPKGVVKAVLDVFNYLKKRILEENLVPSNESFDNMTTTQWDNLFANILYDAIKNLEKNFNTVAGEANPEENMSENDDT